MATITTNTMPSSKDPFEKSTASTSATKGSSSGLTPTSTGAQQSRPHDVVLTFRWNTRSTPFAQRDYVNATSTVEGKLGGRHTQIRADKWAALSERYRNDPVGYKKALKKLRYQDNKDKRIQAANQVVAAATVTSETTQTQSAWATKLEEEPNLE
ncbi:hypothetical protein DHEL01_v209463 [Diaporthe helianthi]|uniref:Uncharacterized protein n=1 Tax=Diaporthe helianthi TaxID=158607 RepID=A0A2P5HPG1_DIAHE|nr:hypothetical protein DHEL01_v209463 [Diaporthe helianthi]